MTDYLTAAANIAQLKAQARARQQASIASAGRGLAALGKSAHHIMAMRKAQKEESDYKDYIGQIKEAWDPEKNVLDMKKVGPPPNEKAHKALREAQDASQRMRMLRAANKNAVELAREQGRIARELENVRGMIQEGLQNNRSVASLRELEARIEGQLRLQGAGHIQELQRMGLGYQQQRGLAGMAHEYDIASQEMGADIQMDLLREKQRGEHKYRTALQKMIEDEAYRERLHESKERAKDRGLRLLRDIDMRTRFFEDLKFRDRVFREEMEDRRKRLALAYKTLRVNKKYREDRTELDKAFKAAEHDLRVYITKMRAAANGGPFAAGQMASIEPPMSLHEWIRAGTVDFDDDKEK